MTQYYLVSNGTITQGPQALPPNYKNVSNFQAHPHPEAFGWYPEVGGEPPTVDPLTETLTSTRVIEGQTVRVSYQVTTKTPEETLDYKRSIAPRSVTPAQAQLALFDAGLFTQAETMAVNHPYAPVRIYWNKALTWELDNPYLQAMAQELGLTEDGLLDLFIAASKK